MDAKTSKPGIQIQTIKGLNTNAAAGTADAPRVLTNGLMVHPGGWSCAPAAQLRLADVGRAVYAGQGADLFVEHAGAVYSYADDAPTLIPNTTGLSLAGAVTLARDLVQAGDAYLSAALGRIDLRHSLTITFWNGTGTAPTGPYYTVGLAPTGNFNSGEAIKVRLVPVRGPDATALTTLLWPTEFTVTTPATSDRVTITFYNMADIVNVYANGASTGNPSKKMQYELTNSNTDGTVQPNFVLSNAIVTTPPVATDSVFLRPAVAEYHTARVYAAGGQQVRYDPILGETVTTAPGNRLFYSEIIASFSATALPFFAEDFYLDMPFKISKKIVAIQSAGRYLYVFGEREVLLLSGHDDTTWYVETIGDSIGAIQAASVQRLQNAAFYLSDSGVMMLMGGQVADISADVRDLLYALDLTKITSTVDFANEFYYLSDGTTTLCWHMQEKAWTTRRADGANQKLQYGGGRPYSVHAGALYSLDATALTTMQLQFGPMVGHSWGQRVIWRGVQLGVESDAGATIALTLVTDVSSVTVTKACPAGLAAVNVSMADAEQVLVSGRIGTLNVTLTPGSSTRATLRGAINLLMDPQVQEVAAE